jgi:hypothetical protein
MYLRHFAPVTGMTHAVRPLTCRTGSEYTYVLNGSRLRDVFVDGRWITVSVSDLTMPRATV